MRSDRNRINREFGPWRPPFYPKLERGTLPRTDHAIVHTLMRRESASVQQLYSVYPLTSSQLRDVDLQQHAGLL